MILYIHIWCTVRACTNMCGKLNAPGFGSAVLKRYRGIYLGSVFKLKVFQVQQILISPSNPRKDASTDQHSPTTVLVLNALQCIHSGETDEEPFARCFLPLSPRALSPVEGGRERPQRSSSFSNRTQVYVGFIGDPTKACLRGFSVTSPALCSVLCYSLIPRTATAFVLSSLSCRGYGPSVEKHAGKSWSEILAHVAKAVLKACPFTLTFFPINTVMNARKHFLLEITCPGCNHILQKEQYLNERTIISDFPIPLF